jgi:ferritin-like metal-binding protein YciE
MAAYERSCVCWAIDDAAEILQVTLDEEHATNDHLTMLAESYINEDAQGEGE